MIHGHFLSTSARAVAGAWLAAFVAITAAITSAAQQQPPQPRFGGDYAALDARRQTLVNDWGVRFAKATGQKLEPALLYDEILSLSGKTTFEAVTHALMTTALTDAGGASLGDALTLVERVESVRGEVENAPGDHQFRMYVRMTPDAVATLKRAQQFKRGADNTVFHKGYPTSYRGEGVPSIQLSIALDNRRADVDVDYRASSFPAGLFNGHLTSANSDVRAGSNYDRHLNRWTGFNNWWAGFLGIRQRRLPEATDAGGRVALPKTPRAGRKNVEVMANDFLKAWLIEGDIVAAMGYVSEQSYACLAQDQDNPSDFDRGVAPFQLMTRLKSARDEVGTRSSLEGLVVATRLPSDGLRVTKQPYQSQFTVYSVRNDIATAFDCASRLTLADPQKVKRDYDTYAGTSFSVAGNRDYPVALLWAREDGYWKIVSWKVGAITASGPPVEPAPEVKTVRIDAEPTLVRAARDFLESWLVRKNYNAAFGYLAPQAYGCYELQRDRNKEAATSDEDAGRKLRASLETAARSVSGDTLDDILSAAEPSHPAVRVMSHPFARVFSLTSLPNALADAAECAARTKEFTVADPLPLEYGNGYGMTVRFKTKGGDAPVLRLLWRRTGDQWRVTSYGVELP